MAEVGPDTQDPLDGSVRPLCQEGPRTVTLEQSSSPSKLRPPVETPSPSATMSVTAEFGSGTYIITNSLHHNNAALLNDNADEPLRGVFPVDQSTFGDNEKVSR